MRKKKIALIYPKRQGGITSVVNTLVKGGLLENGHVYLWPSCYEGGKYLQIYFCLQQYLLFCFFSLIKRPHIYHIHISSNGSFYRKSFYVFLGKLFKRKIIIHIHPTHFLKFIREHEGLKRKLIIRVINSCDIIITLTDNVASELKTINGINLRMNRTLNNPICLSEYCYTSCSSREYCHIVYLGWIIKNKGVYDLVEAAKIVKNKIKEFRLTYYGNKEVDKLRRIISERGYDDFIHVPGWIELDEKRAVLKNSTALILPTYSEGIPNVILEAMASGLPIMTTPVGGIPAILDENENCLFFEPGNINQMADAIIRLIEDKKLQQLISKNNKRKVQKYDSISICKSLFSIYDLL